MPRSIPWTYMHLTGTAVEVADVVNCDNFFRDRLRGVYSVRVEYCNFPLPGLATSGRHNSAMITDRRKFTSKWSLYGLSLIHI